MALDYYSGKRDCPLSDYETKRLKAAPFYKLGMSNDKIVKTLTASFDYIEGKIKEQSIGLAESKKFPFDRFSVQEYRNGVLTNETDKKEPVTYDREWITKLARLEDSVTELRYGPVQKALDVAASVAQGTKELAEGIAKYQADGIYSGFDMGRGISSFLDGWSYGEAVSEMKREYERLSSSENEVDRIAAIDKKMDIKILMNDIRDYANVYEKAATGLRTNCDGMIYCLKRFKEDRENHSLSSSRLQWVKI